MFSFINMGGRKKRRRSKLGKTGLNKRSPRSSGSFISPGDVLNIDDEKMDMPDVHPYSHGGLEMPKDSNSKPIQVQYSAQGSPEIQLEFRHDSLLKSIPKDYLRYRNGSVSGSSLDDLLMVKSPFSQASGSTSTLDYSPRDQRGSPARNRRMARTPTVTPIQIPTVPLDSVPVQRAGSNLGTGASGANVADSSIPNANRDALAVRPISVSFAHSPAWNSDEDDEVDPSSAVSGVSLARDAFAMFSFGSKATYDMAETPGRDMGNRSARQDSATLPTDFNWTSAVEVPPMPKSNRGQDLNRSEGQNHSQRALRSKGSSGSLKRRKRDTSVTELLPAASDVASATAAKEEKEMSEARALASAASAKKSLSPSLSRRPSGPRSRARQHAPVATPFTQKLNYADQAALHRISRIPEADGEGLSTKAPSPAPSASSNSKKSPKPMSPPVLGSSTAASSPASKHSKHSTSSRRGVEKKSPSSVAREVGIALKALNERKEKPGKEKMDYESFLEDFQFASPVSPTLTRQESFSQVNFPMTAHSAGSGSITGSGSASTSAFATASMPTSAMSPGYTFPLSSASSPGHHFAAAMKMRSTMSTTTSPATGNSGRGTFKSGTSHGPSGSLSSLPPYSPLPLPGKDMNSAGLSSQSSPQSRAQSAGRKSPHERNGSISSSAGSTANSPTTTRNKAVPLGVIAFKNNLPNNKDGNVPITRLPIGDGGKSSPTAGPLFPPSPDGEKRRPSLPHLQLGSASPIRALMSPSIQSPDLLDMLIPNGHVVTPISRRRHGRQRSGSTPNPIRIIGSSRRDATNSDNKEGMEDYDDSSARGIGEGDRGDGDRNEEKSNTPSTGDYAHVQSFPQTPEMFSPSLFSPDFPIDVSPPGTSHGIISRNASLSSKLARSLSGNQRIGSLPLQPIIIPSTPPEVPISRRSRSSPELAKAAEVALPSLKSESPPSSSPQRPKSTRSTLNTSSPPISPLQPPPTPPPTLPPSPSPTYQVPLGIAPPPPFLAPAPRQRPTHSRPPLPFGPRKRSQPYYAFTPPGLTQPLNPAARRKAASEGSAGITHAKSRPPETMLSPQVSTPTFKTTPIKWRGLTLDAAQWSFTSSELQSVVKRVIEQFGHASSIRLLSLDVLDKELPNALKQLECRKSDIQGNYKVLARRRDSLLKMLKSVPPSNDPSIIVRFAEELSELTASCDTLTAELYDVCDQIAQITRLKDVHSTSALSMALRKLNASLIQQAADSKALREEVSYLRAEKEVAWNKAEEVERNLEDLNDHLEAVESVEEAAKNPSSRRSSGLSVSRKNSIRASRASYRLSVHRRSQRSSGSASSLRVNFSTSCRTTFSSDIVPPVPPLPREAQTLSGDFTSSHNSMALSSAPPTSTEVLYRAVYDMLGMRGLEQPSSRPQSVVSPPTTFENPPSTGSNDPSLLGAPSQHHRTNSLPAIVPPRREAALQDPELIVAMLQLHQQ